MKKGTVKFFNESKGFGFVMDGGGNRQSEVEFLVRFGL
jgi:cold shock CspA family protein